MKNNNKQQTKNTGFRVDFRFNTLATALRFAARGNKMVVVLGDADAAAPYWVMTPAAAQRAQRAGYEWA